MWYGKDTRLKPNWKPKTEQKIKIQAVKLKENRKTAGLVLRLLGLLCISMQVPWLLALYKIHSIIFRFLKNDVQSPKPSVPLGSVFQFIFIK